MTSNNNSKSANTKHTKVAKSQRQYVRGIIHNLSLQRWTSQEISDYLHDEKKIDIARSTVNSIRRQIEKQAEKWYIELRHSRYKYIASYKERIDSLLSYQKKLHQIIDFYIQPPNQMVNTDTVIRAISELHKIEVSIFSLWKELPQPIRSEETTPSAPEPRPTTYPTIPDPNNPGRWLTDPAYIEENMKKVMKDYDFDITERR
jgi:hypothetical protein